RELLPREGSRRPAQRRRRRDRATAREDQRERRSFVDQRRRGGPESYFTRARVGFHDGRKSRENSWRGSSTRGGRYPRYEPEPHLGQAAGDRLPRQDGEPGPLPRKEYQWQDSAPVSIRLSLLMINDIVLAGLSGQAMTMIHEHLKKELPSIHTVSVRSAK